MPDTTLAEIADAVGRWQTRAQTTLPYEKFALVATQTERVSAMITALRPYCAVVDQAIEKSR